MRLDTYLGQPETKFQILAKKNCGLQKQVRSVIFADTMIIWKNLIKAMLINPN